MTGLVAQQLPGDQGLRQPRGSQDTVDMWRMMLCGGRCSTEGLEYGQRSMQWLPRGRNQTSELAGSSHSHNAQH